MGLGMHRCVDCSACLLLRQGWIDWSVHACQFGSRQKRSAESWVNEGDKVHRPGRML